MSNKGLIELFFVVFGVLCLAAVLYASSCIPWSQPADCVASAQASAPPAEPVEVAWEADKEPAVRRVSRTVYVGSCPYAIVCMAAICDISLDVNKILDSRRSLPSISDCHKVAIEDVMSLLLAGKATNKPTGEHDGKED